MCMTNWSAWRSASCSRLSAGRRLPWEPSFRWDTSLTAGRTDWNQEVDAWSASSSFPTRHPGWRNRFFSETARSSWGQEMGLWSQEDLQTPTPSGCDRYYSSWLTDKGSPHTSISLTDDLNRFFPSIHHLSITLLISCCLLKVCWLVWRIKTLNLEKPWIIINSVLCPWSRVTWT